MRSVIISLNYTFLFSFYIFSFAFSAFKFDT